MATPSQEWKEVSSADEAARFAEFAQRFTVLQKMRARDGAPMRALHAKGHAGLEASLEVFDDLPPHARHGLFAEAGRYEAIVRYSNGSGGHRHDQAGDARGLAVKVLGVEGEKVLGGARTQDFLGVLSPAIPFRNADEFVSFVWAMRNPRLAPIRLMLDLGPLRTFGLLRTIAAGVRTPPASLVTRPFYSAAPIQCGPYAVRFRFAPTEPYATDADTPLSKARNAYADDLALRVREGAVSYTLAVQFFVDERQTPIEDASVDWPVTVAPYVDVGRLVIAKQDTESERGRKLHDAVERLSFDPWHALAAHRPLGNIMRARKEGYFASASGRAAAAEPESLASLLGT